jgi:hypothetical protein
MTLKDLLTQHATVDTNHRTLRALLTRVGRIDGDVEARHVDLMAHPGYAEAPVDHHQHSRAKYQRELRAQRIPAAAVALYLLDRSIPALATGVAAFEQTARRLADPVTEYLRRSGGVRSGLRDEAEMLIDVRDELRRMRLAQQTREWQPSRVLALYERALVADDVSTLAFIEDSHDQGWSGVEPHGDAEVQSARALRRSIDSAQQARVPATVAEMRGTLDTARTAVTRAMAMDLRPINPMQDGKAGDQFEREVDAATKAGEL